MKNMKKSVLSGFLATLLSASAGQASTQGEPRGESPRDAVEMAPDPIVVERELFTLKLDVGVIVDRSCFTVESLMGVCDEVLVLLREHGVRSDLAEEIRTQMEEMLRERLIDEMEAWIKQEIRSEIDEEQKRRDTSAEARQQVDEDSR